MAKIFTARATKVSHHENFGENWQERTSGGEGEWEYLDFMACPQGLLVFQYGALKRRLDTKKGTVRWKMEGFWGGVGGRQAEVAGIEDSRRFISTGSLISTNMYEGD